MARAAGAERVPMIFSNQASRPMEDAPRRWATARAGASSTGAARTSWWRAWPGARRACGCEAIVVTLDTTILGWRPRDLEPAFLPFLRGKGIAQPRAIRSSSRSRPAATRRSPSRRSRRCGRCSRSSAREPTARRCRSSSRSTRGRRSPGRRCRSCASGRGCRSCSRASSTPTTPAGRSTPAWTGSWCPTTAAARWTAGSPPSTRCPA